MSSDTEDTSGAHDYHIRSKNTRITNGSLSDNTSVPITWLWGVVCVVVAFLSIVAATVIGAIWDYGVSTAEWRSRVDARLGEIESGLRMSTKDQWRRGDMTRYAAAIDRALQTWIEELEAANEGLNTPRLRFPNPEDSRN